MPTPAAHKLAVVIPDQVVASDFTVPIDILGRAVTEAGEPCYQIQVCAESKTVESSHFSINVPYTLRVLRRADTVVVAGVHSLAAEFSPAIRHALQQAYERGTRIASVCTGAFLLADAGLLNGKKATTHWLASAALAERYPDVDVDPNVLFVDNGQVLTSAGAMAAADLCLHLIYKDFGPVVAAQSAKRTVLPLARPGGQAQFIEQQVGQRDYGSLQELLIWIENNLSKNLEVQALADRAAMSVRTLNRRFLAQTGLPPNTWVIRCRVRAAQQLLESTRLSLALIADRTGFGSVANFRARFKEIVGANPSDYRQAFSSQHKMAG